MPKKLSKKKLAELKRREEEERLRLEEEEKNRIELERERIALAEQDRVTLLKEARLAALERQRIKEEDDKFTPEWQPKLSLAYESRFLELAERKDWHEFLQCSELPDPENESEINSYLTLWRDQQSSTSAQDADDDIPQRNIEQDFKDCNVAIELYHQIEAAMFRAMDRDEERRVHIHKENLGKIAQSTLDTLDDMTAYIMQFSDLYIDQNTDQYANKTSTIDYGLWVNIAKNARKKYVQFDDIDAVCELALKGMALQKIAIRILHMKNCDPLTITAQQRPLMIPIGGIVYMDILHIPPPPSGHKGWTIRKLTSLSKRVKRKPYEQTDAQGNVVDPPSTRVSFVVPSQVLIRKEVPSVAWWDLDKKTWSQEGIDSEKTKYDPESRKITFYTTHLTTALAVVNERVFDVPYRSWFIRPLPRYGRNAAVYTIKPCAHPTEVAYIEDIVIFIFNDQCKMLSPLRPELEHITSKWLEPRVLLQRLAESGINLVVGDEDAQFTDRLPKHSDVEQKAYREMSWLGNVCSFASSKWNQDLQVGQDKVVFRVSQKLFEPSNAIIEDLPPAGGVTFKGLSEEGYFQEPQHLENWENVAYWNFKASFISCKDSSESSLSLETLPNHDTHLNLALCLDERRKDAEVLRRIEEEDLLVCETIRILLSATRPLSWC